MSEQPPDGGAPALVVVDVVNDFDHEDAEHLLECMARRIDGMVRTLEGARRRGWPVIYANDNFGVWDGDAPRMVREAMEGPGAAMVARIAPRPGDRFITKPGYSAFDHTPLAPLLESLEAGAVVLMGSASEMCVRESAIDAARLGLRTAVVREGCVTIDPDRERLAFAALEELTGTTVVDRIDDLDETALEPDERG